MCNWGCFVFTHSSLMATSSPEAMFAPARGGANKGQGHPQRDGQLYASTNLCLHLSSSVPLGGGCKGGRGLTLYPREAEGAPGPAWAEGESENCSTCQGAGGDELGTVQRTTCQCSKKAGCEGGQGHKRLTDHGKGTLAWRVGAAELDRGAVSGVLSRGGENGAGQRSVFRKSRERLKSKPHVASVSPAILTGGLSWRARGEAERPPPSLARRYYSCSN